MILPELYTDVIAFPFPEPVEATVVKTVPKSTAPLLVVVPFNLTDVIVPTLSTPVHVEGVPIVMFVPSTFAIVTEPPADANDALLFVT